MSPREGNDDETAGRSVADSFDAQTKKVWRIGNEYLRFEDAPNPQTEVHGLIIVAEPDIWIMDRNTNQAPSSSALRSTDWRR